MNMVVQGASSLHVVMLRASNATCNRRSGSGRGCSGWFCSGGAREGIAGSRLGWWTLL